MGRRPQDLGHLIPVLNNQANIAAVLAVVGIGLFASIGLTERLVPPCCPTPRSRGNAV